MTSSAWQKIHPQLFLLQDSCNVYALQGPEGTLLLNAGTGLAADQLAEVAQDKPATVLLTLPLHDAVQLPSHTLKKRIATGQCICPKRRFWYLTSYPEYRILWRSNRKSQRRSIEQNNRWHRSIPAF